MKKIALAVSAALLAGSAMAANVDLYGRIDTGFSYTNERTKVTGNEALNGTASTKKFSMDSGNSTGSRWGLKGSEDLGNGYKVGFVLESGFSSDTGKGSDDGLFNRESTISVSGPFGTIYAGRMGSLISDLGSAGWYGSMASPFGSGWGEIAGHQAVMSMQGRKNNTLIYMSPRQNGLQFSAQYSMGDEGSENKPKTDRYAAIGVDYQVGNLEVAGLIDYMNKKSSLGTAKSGKKTLTKSDQVDDAWTFNLAANYDFGFLKAFAAAQYYKDASDLGGQVASYQSDVKDTITRTRDQARLDDLLRTVSLKGYGLNIGADVPVFGGNFMVSAGYADADVRRHDTKSKYKIGTLKGYTALAGYSYPFSKRTSVYAGAGYTQYKLSLNKSRDNKSLVGTSKTQTFQAMAGLVHKF